MRTTGIGHDQWPPLGNGEYRSLFNLLLGHQHLSRRPKCSPNTMQSIIFSHAQRPPRWRGTQPNRMRCGNLASPACGRAPTTKFSAWSRPPRRYPRQETRRCGSQQRLEQHACTGQVQHTDECFVVMKRSRLEQNENPRPGIVVKNSATTAPISARPAASRRPASRYGAVEAGRITSNRREKRAALGTSVTLR